MQNVKSFLEVIQNPADLANRCNLTPVRRGDGEWGGEEGQEGAGGEGDGNHEDALVSSVKPYFFQPNSWAAASQVPCTQAGEEGGGGEEGGSCYVEERAGEAPLLSLRRRGE